MPNYCENELILVGGQDDIEEVFDSIRGDKSIFDFNTITPYPEIYQKRDDEYAAIESDEDQEAFIEKWGDRRDGYNSGGYEWCCENWGTKWNAITPERFRNRLFFDTAWEPPAPVIVALARKFPRVSFHLEYFERGMQYCGGFSCLGKEDWCPEDGNDGRFEPGLITNEWEGVYEGHKGG